MADQIVKRPVTEKTHSGITVEQSREYFKHVVGTVRWAQKSIYNLTVRDLPALLSLRTESAALEIRKMAKGNALLADNVSRPLVRYSRLFHETGDDVNGAGPSLGFTIVVR